MKRVNYTGQMDLFMNMQTGLNGVRHRTDRPAFEGANGYKAVCMPMSFPDMESLLSAGVLHRTDGPAVEYADGSKSWYLNGVLHRTDGPAIEWADGSKEWFLNGILLTEDLFLKLTKGPVKKLPLYLGMGFDQFISERLKIIT